MSSSAAALKRSLVFIHRWLGVALCVIFLIWFPSAIGIMYWDFPSVTPADRLERAASLDPAALQLSPGEAYATLGWSDPPTQIRLNTFDRRPVFRFRGRGGERLVYADTGEQQTDVSEEMRLRIASAWSGQPGADAKVVAVTEIDQWTVGGALRNLRPLWKYSWPDGQQVYVAGATGEVVQYTTTSSRLGAYLGAIPHWLYFTPLRTHQVAWSRFVIWVSGLATVSALLGLVIGVWMYSPRRRYRYGRVSTSIPYRGQKRWHMMLGLIFGLGAATWAFSGMLSMDPFPLESESRRPGSGITQALRGRAPLAAFSAKDPRQALAQIMTAQRGIANVKELEFAAFDGDPIYVATVAGGTSLIVPVAGEPMPEFDQERIIDVVKRAAQPDAIVDARVITQYDAYYLDRRRQSPLPVILARLGDAEHTRYYIDPKTALVVGGYGSRDWIRRWLYHALHSLDFPWLYNHRPLWDIVVITMMLGGTALCVTSLILAWRVVGRKLGRSSVEDAPDPTLC